jgi:hypothetical protein
MTVTPTTLTRAAGVAAAVAGLLFIGVQINHPHMDATFATTTEYTVRESLKVLMAALALTGITGMYLRQVKQTGALGLLGYILFGAGVLARWAAALLAVGSLATMAIPLLPQVNYRLFAIPTGVALVGLGYSLWREQRTPAAVPVPSPVSANLGPAGAR